jgi:hypothetical protein
VIHEVRNAFERPPNQPCLVVRRHHDHDSSTCEHYGSFEGDWK